MSGLTSAHTCLSWAGPLTAELTLGPGIRTPKLLVQGPYSENPWVKETSSMTF